MTMNLETNNLEKENKMATPKQKMPTGERPKQLSSLAKTVKSKTGVNASEAASRAGKVRNITNQASTVGRSDANGLALKKAYSPSQAKNTVKPTSAKYNFEKEAAKFIGGAAKANMKLPGEVVKIIKMHGSQMAKDLKKGYNKK
jgi:hypothetical protein